MAVELLMVEGSTAVFAVSGHRLVWEASNPGYQVQLMSGGDRPMELTPRLWASHPDKLLTARKLHAIRACLDKQDLDKLVIELQRVDGDLKAAVRVGPSQDKGPAVATQLTLSDGRYAEEILRNGEPTFIIADKDGGNVQYATSITDNGRTVTPAPINDNELRSLTLADGVEEYGSLQQLRVEMLEFALAEFDPKDNLELFKLIVNGSLLSWVPEWQENLGERFLPIIQTRGPSESGKKRFLTTLRWLFYRSFYALKTYRCPSLFRPLSKWRGTLILDEADVSRSSFTSEFIQFLNSRADGVPIPRFNAEKSTVEYFCSFGNSLLALRGPLNDTGAESRSIVFPAEATDSPEKYDLIPPPEWVARGRTLQKKLLLFRLRNRATTRTMPTNLVIPNVGFRVREALLFFKALEDQDPTITADLTATAQRLEQRLIADRARTTEGLVLNIVYEWLDDGGLPVKTGTDFRIDKISTRKEKDEELEVSVPLTLRQISESLSGAMSPSQISGIWRGLGQKIQAQGRVGPSRYRGILLISSPKRLQKEFQKFVVDAQDMSKLFSTQTNLEGKG